MSDAVALMPETLSAGALFMFQRCDIRLSWLSGFGIFLCIHLVVFFTEDFALAQILKLMDQS